MVFGAAAAAVVVVLVRVAGGSEGFRGERRGLRVGGF